MFFANPLFLIALVAVAIPVVVHLFNFRRYRRVYFSNVERISVMQQETRRQSRLRQLLLLAARILAIIFLVLAFAQPVIPTKHSIQRGGSNTVSIYIDNSLSMQNHDEEMQLLDQARERARDIANAFDPSDQFMLMTADMAGKEFRWLSRDDLLLALDELQLSPRSTTLATAARRMHDFAIHSATANRHAFLLSDCQKGACDFDGFPSDSTMHYTIVPLKAASIDNVYIDSVALTAPAFNRGAQIDVEVTLHNSSRSSVERSPVSLYVNGRQRALASVDLPSQGNAKVLMSFVADSDGVADCYVETVDYPLTFDDRLYFSVNIAPQVRVLVVGKESASLQRLYATDSLVQYRRTTEGSVDFASLGNNNLVVLNAIGTISTGLAEAVRSFVEQGGSLLVLPAMDADRESYNRMLLTMQAPTLGEWKENAKPQLLTLNRDAWLLHGVMQGRNNDIEMPTPTAAYTLQSNASTSMEPVMQQASGSLYLTHTTYGAGHLYLMADALDNAHNDLTHQAIFVPLFFNMALYSRQQSECYYTFDHNGPIAVAQPFAALAGQARLALVGGTFEMIPDISTTSGTPTLMLHSMLSEPGNYHLKADGTAPMGLSFNYSRNESEMTFMSADEVERQLPSKNANVASNGGKALAQHIRQATTGIELWRWCVVLTLLMLAAEIAIIRWPSRKTKPSTKA